MKHFTSVDEAFAWFLDNIYRDLPADEKKGELVNAWRNYTFKKGISQQKMIGILERYGFETKTLVMYKGS